MEVQSTSIFEEWLKNLKDLRGRNAIARRLQVLEKHGHFGDCKHITGVIFELRIHTGPGYRLYVAKRGEVLVILLCGGDKSTQQKDIIKAQEIFKDLP
ncbi:type II toxin-antitoxin system RelE/ParE family toxin [Helicobacter bizzozeronii]|uniref:type II toxin-antitoxin system RelE/ParE family toxin n=1 Tax=Helicobacter bizzozeronii TaxID=56877 RepID=UPI00244D825C|nr:type II toxin-antitoxin system RelE/ParE family toxin [Helicobacter bizzozeronii]GMB93880.1 type II toxin-antitoxin system RelE/ParE family toxin [Helicobacter bizzozeronii]